MSGFERALLASRLALAIDHMAGRYGVACMKQAYATIGSDEHAAAERRATRQYKALQRLTAALRRIADGGAS